MKKGVALDKIIAEEKVKTKFKDLKDEAAADLSGDELKERLEELESERKQELKEAKKDIDVKAKDDEKKIREQKEEKFTEEKTELVK